MYCLDTNIFLDWWERRYPPDVFPAVQLRIESLVGTGKCAAPERVKDELNHVAPRPLQAWAAKQAGLFVIHDVPLQTEANRIQAVYPGMIDHLARHDEADRYLIALAKLRGWTVVTHETPARSKRHPPRTHYIPDVCLAEGVQCIELMRGEAWTF